MYSRSTPQRNQQGQHRSNNNRPPTRASPAGPAAAVVDAGGVFDNNTLMAAATQALAGLNNHDLGQPSSSGSPHLAATQRRRKLMERLQRSMDANEYEQQHPSTSFSPASPGGGGGGGGGSPLKSAARHREVLRDAAAVAGHSLFSVDRLRQQGAEDMSYREGLHKFSTLSPARETKRVQEQTQQVWAGDSFADKERNQATHDDIEIRKQKFAAATKAQKEHKSHVEILAAKEKKIREVRKGQRQTLTATALAQVVRVAEQQQQQQQYQQQHESLHRSMNTSSGAVSPSPNQPSSPKNDNNNANIRRTAPRESDYVADAQGGMSSSRRRLLREYLKMEEGQRQRQGAGRYSIIDAVNNSEPPSPVQPQEEQHQLAGVMNQDVNDETRQQQPNEQEQLHRLNAEAVSRVRDERWDMDREASDANNKKNDGVHLHDKTAPVVPILPSWFKDTQHHYVVDEKYPNSGLVNSPEPQQQQQQRRSPIKQQQHQHQQGQLRSLQQHQHQQGQLRSLAAARSSHRIPSQKRAFPTYMRNVSGGPAPDPAVVAANERRIQHTVQEKLSREQHWKQTRDPFSTMRPSQKFHVPFRAPGTEKILRQKREQEQQQQQHNPDQAAAAAKKKNQVKYGFSWQRYSWKDVDLNAMEDEENDLYQPPVRCDSHNPKHQAPRRSGSRGGGAAAAAAAAEHNTGAGSNYAQAHAKISDALQSHISKIRNDQQQHRQVRARSQSVQQPRHRQQPQSHRQEVPKQQTQNKVYRSFTPQPAHSSSAAAQSTVSAAATKPRRAQQQPPQPNPQQQQHMIRRRPASSASASSSSAAERTERRKRPAPTQGTEPKAKPKQQQQQQPQRHHGGKMNRSASIKEVPRQTAKSTSPVPSSSPSSSCSSSGELDCTVNSSAVVTESVTTEIRHGSVNASCESLPRPQQDHHRHEQRQSPPQPQPALPAVVTIGQKPRNPALGSMLLAAQKKSTSSSGGESDSSPSPPRVHQQQERVPPDRPRQQRQSQQQQPAPRYDEHVPSRSHPSFEEYNEMNSPARTNNNDGSSNSNSGHTKHSRPAAAAGTSIGLDDSVEEVNIFKQSSSQGSGGGTVRADYHESKFSSAHGSEHDHEQQQQRPQPRVVREYDLDSSKSSSLSHSSSSQQRSQSQQPQHQQQQQEEAEEEEESIPRGENPPRSVTNTNNLHNRPPSSTSNSSHGLPDGRFSSSTGSSRSGAGQACDIPIADWGSSGADSSNNSSNVPAPSAAAAAATAAGGAAGARRRQNGSVSAPVAAEQEAAELAKLLRNQHRSQQHQHQQRCNSASGSSIVDETEEQESQRQHRHQQQQRRPNAGGEQSSSSKRRKPEHERLEL